MMQGEWIRKPKAGTSIVFVHGILSSGETCWRHENNSYWPELLKNESEFEPAGIYVFTYQTDLFSGTYRLGDIVDALKEHMRLDDVLKSERIIFVCHSMGGIVVRKFLVERTVDLIERKTEIGLFLVASPSLGSSYANWLSPLAKILGHMQADVLRFGQDNAWLNDLDKEFINLKEAGKLKIKGLELTEDKFVLLKKWWRKQIVEPFAGARYFGEPYKVPLSDHFSIAKPDGKDAIQHRKLCEFIRGLGQPPQPKEPPVSPTPGGKVGIWVARFRGDEAQYANQRDIIQHLQRVLKNEPELKNLIEVRELPLDIPSTLSDEEIDKFLQTLSKQHNAPIIIWGEITTILNVKRLTPWVAFIKPSGKDPKSYPLNPVSERILLQEEQQQVLQLSGAVPLPPERIREPLQLGRYVIAVTYYDRSEWDKAAFHFNEFIKARSNADEIDPELYSFAGAANMLAFDGGRNAALGYSAIDYFAIAVRQKENKARWRDCANLHFNLGIVHWFLADQEEKPQENWRKSFETFQKAVDLYTKIQDRRGVALCYSNMSMAYRAMAKQGINIEANLKSAIEALKKAAAYWETEQNWIEYGTRMAAQGLTYAWLAREGIEPVNNLRQAIDTLLIAARMRREGNDKKDCAEVLNSLALTYERLADMGIEEIANLENAVKTFEESAAIFNVIDKKRCAGVLSTLGTTYRKIAVKGVQPEQNHRNAIRVLCNAAAIWNEQQEWIMYGNIQSVLGDSYRELAKLNDSSEENIDAAVECFRKAASTWEQQNKWDQYAKEQKNIAVTFWRLAPNGNESKIIESLLEAFAAYEDKLFDYSAAYELANQWFQDAPSDLYAELSLSEASFTTARFSEAEEHLAIALLHSQLGALGIPYRLLEIATLLALNKVETIRDRLQTLHSSVVNEDFSGVAPWQFQGIKNFLKHNDKLGPYSAPLMDLFTALEVKDGKLFLELLAKVNDFI